MWGWRVNLMRSWGPPVPLKKNEGLEGDRGARHGPCVVHRCHEQLTSSLIYRSVSVGRPNLDLTGSTTRCGTKRPIRYVERDVSVSTSGRQVCTTRETVTTLGLPQRGHCTDSWLKSFHLLNGLTSVILNRSRITVWTDRRYLVLNFSLTLKCLESRDGCPRFRPS